MQTKHLLCVVSPLLPLPHLALPWILSKVENLASSSLQDEAKDWLFFTELLCPTLIINLAHLISLSVALLAELISTISFIKTTSVITLKLVNTVTKPAFMYRRLFHLSEFFTYS